MNLALIALIIVADVCFAYGCAHLHRTTKPLRNKENYP